MCELLSIRSEKMFPIKTVLDYAELLDQFGIAGFGWGIVWKNKEGKLQGYKSVEGIRSDPLARTILSGVESTEYLVHLRRPSLMTTVGQSNVQPYLDTKDDFAFCHNGFFVNHNKYRATFADEIKGTSDSEVGFCYLESTIKQGSDMYEAIIDTHEAMQGKANMLILCGGGKIYAYNGSEENLMYQYQMDGAEVISTALHSLDNFLFESVFPKACHIKKLPRDTVINM